MPDMSPFTIARLIADLDKFVFQVAVEAPEDKDELFLEFMRPDNDDRTEFEPSDIPKVVAAIFKAKPDEVSVTPEGKLRLWWD